MPPLAHLPPPSLAYTDPSTKDALVKALTSIYIVFGLSACYLVVHFIQVVLDVGRWKTVTQFYPDRDVSLNT
ncbi:hypothetical protein MKX07_000449 [Trichoderma sp. CBMAI-0711]|nr:hypothetical protein MKX07_000449 [Trichoderma sp. CBMAI-0711]